MPASECESWRNHCHAHSGSSVWSSQRDAAKAQRASLAKKKARAAARQNGTSSGCDCIACLCFDDWLAGKGDELLVHSSSSGYSPMGAGPAPVIDLDCVFATAEAAQGCKVFKVRKDSQ